MSFLASELHYFVRVIYTQPNFRIRKTDFEMWCKIIYKINDDATAVKLKCPKKKIGSMEFE